MITAIDANFADTSLYNQMSYHLIRDLTPKIFYNYTGLL